MPRLGQLCWFLLPMLAGVFLIQIPNFWQIGHAERIVANSIPRHSSTTEYAVLFAFCAALVLFDAVYLWWNGMNFISLWHFRFAYAVCLLPVSVMVGYCLTFAYLYGYNVFHAVWPVVLMGQVVTALVILILTSGYFREALTLNYLCAIIASGVATYFIMAKPF